MLIVINHYRAKGHSKDYDVGPDEPDLGGFGDKNLAGSVGRSVTSLIG